MNYFVSITPTEYHFWQTKLLLESFREADLAHSLVIAVCGDRNLPEWLRQHPSTHVVPAWGEIRGYEKLNWLYALHELVPKKAIEPPFVRIEPDMVLHHPIADGGDFDVSFQVDPELTVEAAEANGVKLSETLERIKQDKPLQEGIDFWLPVGRTIVFNALPEFLIARTIRIVENMALEQLAAEHPIWKHTDRAALACVFLECLQFLRFRATYDLEMTMMEAREMRNFVHYEHGMPPTFSKRMFGSHVRFSTESPFHVLSRLAPTPASHHVQKIAARLV